MGAGNMKTVEIDEGDGLDVFSAVHVGKCVHLYNRSSLQSIVRAPSAVRDICLTKVQTSSGGGWLLYVLCRDRTVYRVTRQQVFSEREQVKKETARHKSDNQEIFSDLLGGDTTPDPFELQSTSSDVYILKENQAVLKVADGAVSISVACGFIAVVSENQKYFVTDLYLEKTAEVTEYTNLPTLTFYLQRTRVKNTTEKFRSSVLFVVSDLHVSEEVVCSSVLNLPSSLFQSLFGSELVLINSPVLLICPPDGGVFYAPVKTVDTSFNNTDQNLCTFKVLCHTNFPVLKIKESNLKTRHRIERDNGLETAVPNFISEENLKLQPSLILCTTDGFSLVITVNDSKQVVFFAFSVLGPVECFDIYGDQLYHSTRSDLIKTKIEFYSEGALHGLHVSECRSLSYEGVQNLVCLPRHGVVNSSSCDLLIQIPESGFKVICLDKRISRSKFLSGNVDNNLTGQRIGDLLHCIDNCCSRSDQVMSLQSQRTSFLSQLNIASNLLGSCFQKKCLKEMFSVKFAVEKVCHGIYSSLHCDWLMVCHVTNNSLITLSFDWMLMVSTKQKRQTDVDKNSVIYTFNLPDGLRTQATVSFEICPLRHDSSLLNPLETETSLVLHLPEFMLACSGDQTSYETQPFHTSSVLPVSLSHSTIDILYSLRVGTTTRLEPVNLTHDQSVEDVITRLAISRPVSECLKIETNITMAVANYPAEMKLAFPRVVKDNPNVTRYGRGNSAFLKYLLEHSSVSFDIQENHVSLLSLAGHKVQLTMEDQRDKESGGGDVVIVVQASDMATAVAVHQAIISRVKELNDDVGLNKEKLTILSSELSKLEGYLKAVRAIQGEKRYLPLNTEDEKKLTQLYEKVRTLHN